MFARSVASSLLLLISCDAHLYGPDNNFSWGSIDLDKDGTPENYLTPIKKQLCSDCFLYAVLGALEIQFKIDHKITDEIDLSEQSIHNCLKIPCNGLGDQRIILNYVKKYGVMEEKYSPAGSWDICPNCSVSVSSIPFYSFMGYNTVISPQTPYEKVKKIMVDALQNGPLIVEISGWNGWKNDDGVLYCDREIPSGHTVIVVGYENDGDIFLIKNSYGGDKLTRMRFEGGNKCGFAHLVNQIVPMSTYIFAGMGKEFC